MAADWIKMRSDLYRDPKVCMMAEALLRSDGDLARHVNQNCQREMTVTRNVTRNAVVGALVSVWGVMRQRGKRDGEDLLCASVTIEVIDDVADLPGFGEAMAGVGWATETEDGVVFPNFFEEYNVEAGAAKASSSADRQRRYRERKKTESYATVGVTRDVTRDVTVTPREEKRRGEKKEQEQATAAAPADVFDPRQWLTAAGVSADLARDFLKLRKEKRATVTETAAKGIEREAAKAGLSVAAAVQICCERNWQGFKAEWLNDRGGTQPAAPQPVRTRQEL